MQEDPIELPRWQFNPTHAAKGYIVLWTNCRELESYQVERSNCHPGANIHALITKNSPEQIQRIPNLRSFLGPETKYP